MPERTEPNRRWIKVGDDPVRYEYGRKNDSPETPAVEDQLAYVEEEKHNSYFHWQGNRIFRKLRQRTAREFFRNCICVV